MALGFGQGKRGTAEEPTFLLVLLGNHLPAPPCLGAMARATLPSGMAKKASKPGGPVSCNSPGRRTPCRIGRPVVTRTPTFRSPSPRAHK
jgi:hypothetical protein